MISRRVRALEPSIIREMFNRRRPTSIDLSLGEPAIPPDRDLVQSAYEAMISGPAGYTPNPGLIEVREAIARHHRLPGRDRAENVIITVGSEEAVFLSLLSVLDPGDEILVPDPGYPAYRGIARLLGATPVPVPVDRAAGLVMTPDAIRRAAGPKARALILNSPSNPFGSIDTEASLAEIAAIASERGLTVISDEIYSELWYGASKPPSITATDRGSILVTGLSKSCAMTGLRLGWLVADAELVKKATLAHQLMVTCAPRLAQLAALEVMRRPERLRAHVPYYLAAREAVREAAKALPKDATLHLGEGAFYAILDVSAYAGPDAMALPLRLLEEEDVVAVPGVAFGPSGTWFWRLSYAAGAAAVTEGIRRIARFLDRQRVGPSAHGG